MMNTLSCTYTGRYPVGSSYPSTIIWIRVWWVSILPIYIGSILYTVLDSSTVYSWWNIISCNIPTSGTDVWYIRYDDHDHHTTTIVIPITISLTWCVQTDVHTTHIVITYSGKASFPTGPYWIRSKPYDIFYSQRDILLYNILWDIPVAILIVLMIHTTCTTSDTIWT